MCRSVNLTILEVAVKRWTVPTIAILLIATGCTSDDEPASTTAPPTTAAIATTTTEAPTTTSGVTPTSLPPIVIPALNKPSFGELTEVPLLSSGDPYAGPDTPTSLSSVLVPAWVDDYLQANNAESQLLDNGFVVVPGSTRHFHHIYEGAAYDGYPVYLTTDTAYHVWHLAFDKILREAEQQTLLPTLEDMLVPPCRSGSCTRNRTRWNRTSRDSEPRNPVLRSGSHRART